MEKNIAISLTEEEFDEVLDALRMMKVFWEKIEKTERVDKIEVVIAEIIRQNVEANLRN